MEKKTEELILEARNFFESYKKELGKTIREGSNVISIDFNSLSENAREVADSLLSNPEETISILELAAEELGFVTNPVVRLLVLQESYSEKIRNLRAKHLNKLIQVEGIIRQASEVRPQVVNAKFECPSCGTIISVLQIEARFREPTRCTCGRKGGFKLMTKEMVDAQRIVIEESPDALEGGEQPRRISVFLKKDLVDPRMEERTTPGSRVKIIGILKEIPRLSPAGGILTRYDIAVEANNVIPMEETFENLDISEEDEMQIKEMAADPRILDRFIESISPSVYGHTEIKKSLALQLFGGVKKTRSDGTKTRGDIHVLLVGDPGVAKSVMLKFISGIAPKGRYVAGRGTSGAGLTATVVRDEFLRGWSLEAGAMVLANKGLVCIDELEKMDPQDRSAMHESMEQQSVTVSKANVQATLRSETSVLAAANPKFGRFDPYQTVASQIDIPPTLINRFDVIFILKDNPDRAKDEAIANHVLMEHKQEGGKAIIERELFRKYIAYSKQKVFPKLTDEAVEEIKKFYVDLRNTSVSLDQPTRPLPISARQLEALIRLSEACARCRLSKKVSREDAMKAIDLMKYYLMQVGYDYETKTFDIDRIASGVSSSQRGKIMLVKDTIAKLENKLGKLIPVEELKKELEGKIDDKTLEEAVEKLTTSGDIFHPRKGFIQKM
ncbi:minichromosome maintenance protein MCM [Candidatus Pacearchaeota archaeon]|nr:minichromosome maintenance protein MCM [Candidatus Pacearchaeota archaeon]